MVISAVIMPTEISMPPVIMTMLMPQDRMIMPAFSLRMLQKELGLRKPEPRKAMAVAYMTKNTTMVMVSSRLLSDITKRFCSRPFF